jgi:hypothetical protein
MWNAKWQHDTSRKYQLIFHFVVVGGVDDDNNNDNDSDDLMTVDRYVKFDSVWTKAVHVENSTDLSV